MKVLINSASIMTHQELAEKIVIELNKYAMYFIGDRQEYICERRNHENIIFGRTVVEDDYEYNHHFSEIWQFVPEALYDEFDELNIDQQEEIVDYIKDVYPDWRP